MAQLHRFTQSPCRAAWRAGALALAVAALATVPGCIRSRVHITSEPEGAEVLWRGEPYGATPITIPFIWYWHYDFALEKPGYERLEVTERFRTPPWFLMPLDLIAELIPVPLPDNRERHYVLKVKPQGGLLDDQTGPRELDLNKLAPSAPATTSAPATPAD